jgi:5-methylcytosine-specific restriction endonuclease McrA
MRNALMSAIIERDGYYCKNCNSTENITIDHIVPVSKGGKNILSNLQLLCRSCNSKKGAK